MANVRGADKFDNRAAQLQDYRPDAFSRSCSGVVEFDENAAQLRDHRPDAFNCSCNDAVESNQRAAHMQSTARRSPTGTAVMQANRSCRIDGRQSSTH